MKRKVSNSDIFATSGRRIRTQFLTEDKNGVLRFNKKLKIKKK